MIKSKRLVKGTLRHVVQIVSMSRNVPRSEGAKGKLYRQVNAKFAWFFRANNG